MLAQHNQPMSNLDYKDHAYLVRHIARRVKLLYAPHEDLEDLIQVGSIGLMDAWARFDTSKGCKFSTYARHRIQGQILDDLRRNKHSYDSFVHDSTTDSEESTLDRIADHALPSPESAAIQKETQSLLELALQKLNERDQKVVCSNAIHEVTFREIGKLLSISETRVFQLYRRSISQLKMTLLEVQSVEDLSA